MQSSLARKLPRLLLLELFLTELGYLWLRLENHDLVQDHVFNHLLEPLEDLYALRKLWFKLTTELAELTALLVQELKFVLTHKSLWTL